jgi:hypothetical protein
MYDADYYERGIETGKSNYQNYRWIPELTIPMAMTIIDILNIKRGDTVLDYGCAKGYLVKALRLLHRDAWGFDISRYAYDNADLSTKSYLIYSEGPYFPYSNNISYKYGICKDVLEHIPLEDLKKLLVDLRVEKLFTVVPLGNEGEYFAQANNMDNTHVICEPTEWWLNLFEECGWILSFASGKLNGIKDSYPNGTHLFATHIRGHL